MTDAVLACPPAWESWISPWTRRLRTTGELTEQRWGTLLLPPGTAGAIQAVPVACACLLVEGSCRSELLDAVETAYVITYGLSPRDSLTLSSLREPVLCVQRSLTRPDGTVIEPQELPLPNLPLPPEQMLPLLGLRLLQMPLIGTAFL